MSASSISILVTAFREAETLPAALDTLLPQAAEFGAEILVICPDDETATAAAQFPQVRVLRDPAKGKPHALNLALAETQNHLVVMTDGDVWIDQGALSALLLPFHDPDTGAVSGRPISISSRNTMLGYWSHLLTDAGAHAERMKRDDKGQFFVCSGYLYAVRHDLISEIPEDALAEDAVVSHLIGEQGYRIRYAPNARVFVRYPTTYEDWLRQKVRSAGGYAQPIIASSRLRMRSFWHEAILGSVRALRYARGMREFLWTCSLFAARLHLWFLILWRVRIQRQPLSQLWQRAETTK
jgi:cellulose synthase/poly-beta-1,6-N-acetylglucosamine synthase-like glycosyltransferase